MLVDGKGAGRRWQGCISCENIVHLHKRGGTWDEVLTCR